MRNLIDTYLDEMLAEGKAEKTVATYRSALYRMDRARVSEYSEQVDTHNLLCTGAKGGGDDLNVALMSRSSERRGEKGKGGRGGRRE